MKMNLDLLFLGRGDRCGWTMCPVWWTGVSYVPVEWTFLQD